MARRGGGPFLGRWRTPKEPALPVDPALALTRTSSALYTWNLATDALAWSPGTAGLLGLPDMSALASGQAFAEAVEPGSGAGREAAIGDGPAADAGCGGFPYAARYALRLAADRLVTVEDTGRWLPDAEGRPALAHGMIRVHAAGDEDSGLAPISSPGSQTRSRRLTGPAIPCCWWRETSGATARPPCRR
jgi:hypothetical protein